MSLLETGSLQRHLIDASKDSIRESIASIGDWVTSARTAGQALELLAKAVIFGRDRTAISAASKEMREPVAAFLEGRGHPGVWSMAEVTTVTGPVAVKLAYDLIDEGALESDQVNAVFYPRNRAVHMVQADDKATLSAIARSLVLAVPLLEEVDMTLADWIGDDRGLAEIAHAATSAALAPTSAMSTTSAVALAKRWRAQQEWAVMRQRLPADVLTDLAADPRVKPDVADAYRAPCPTGGHFAWFELELERSDVQDGDDGEVTYDVYLYALDCPLCGLDVDFPELEALGLGDPVGQRYREQD